MQKQTKSGKRKRINNPMQKINKERTETKKEKRNENVSTLRRN